jgi:hypothetical protein
MLAIRAVSWGFGVVRPLNTILLARVKSQLDDIDGKMCGEVEMPAIRDPSAARCCRFSGAGRTTIGGQGVFPEDGR